MTKAIGNITSPKYKNTNNAATLVAKLSAFAFAVASIKLFPLKATLLTVKKILFQGQTFHHKNQ